MSRIGNLFRGFRAPSGSHSEASASEPSEAWMIVGLGNPGGEYRRSRHNLGFMVVDRLAKRSVIELSRRKFNAIYGDGQIEGRRIFLVQAQTYYYNETGPSVLSALGYFKIPPE